MKHEVFDSGGTLLYAETVPDPEPIKIIERKLESIGITKEELLVLLGLSSTTTTTTTTVIP